MTQILPYSYSCVFSKGCAAQPRLTNDSSPLVSSVSHWTLDITCLPWCPTWKSDSQRRKISWLCFSNIGLIKQSLSLEHWVSKVSICPSDSNGGRGSHVVRSTVTGISLLARVAHFSFVQLWTLKSFFLSCTVMSYFYGFCLLVLVLCCFCTVEASRCWIQPLSNHCGCKYGMCRDIAVVLSTSTVTSPLF